MRPNDPVDTPRLSLTLTDLRLPGIARPWHTALRFFEQPLPG